MESLTNEGFNVVDYNAENVKGFKKERMRQSRTGISFSNLGIVTWNELVFFKLNILVIFVNWQKT